MTTKTRFPGWRHMSAAQRYNARMDAIWARAKDAKTRFNAQSRIEADTPTLLNPLSQDEAEIARRRVAARLRPNEPQEAMNIGLFSDVKNQKELF